MPNLAKPTNNLISNIFIHGTQAVVPTVGMGVTIPLYTDRHAGTIVEVVSPTKIVVQEDNAIRTDSNGQSDTQEYRYEPNPKASRVTFTKRKNGNWVQQGQSLKNGQHLIIGKRNAFHDFSF